MEWYKSPHEGPYNIDENTQFFIISDESKRNLFLIGGHTINEEATVKIPNFSTQRFDGEGWHILSANFTRPFNMMPATIPLDFYWNNNWPKIDIDKLPPKSKQGLWQG